MKAKRLWLAVGGAAALFLACQINDVECGKECMDYWMDGPHYDDSLYTTDSLHRVIRHFPNPDSSLLKKPVILAVHGFTASTYEWSEFWDWAEQRRVDGIDTTLVSLVLLGGHGRDIGDFQASTWHDWGKPILDEYDSLVAKGYANISIAGSSTGCTLLIHYIEAGEFSKRKVIPRWFFLIDPIVTPSSKILSLVNIVGPILGNSPNTDLDSAERKYWYTNRPQEDLAELYDLLNRVKNELEDGIDLPAGAHAKVWKSKHDGSADPVSALQIYKGLHNADGSRIEVEMVDSRKHVFTRLHGRDPATLSAADSALQMKTFTEMAAKARPSP
jgi:carboxylesterase